MCPLSPTIAKGARFHIFISFAICYKHIHFLYVCVFSELSEQRAGLREPGADAHEAGSGTTEADRANAEGG